MTEPLTPSDFEILYEEGPCLIVNKPGGVLTQAPPGIDSIEIRVKRFLKQREKKEGKVYLGVPHRLDRPVSGAIVFGKHVRATRRLCEQFEGRLVEKKYWSIVEGIVEPDAGVWTDYVRKIPDQPQAEIVAEEAVGAKQAALTYRTLARFEGGTLLEIELGTGRMHQIRVQAGSRGHAVWGDLQYGSNRSFGPQTDDLRARWIALHARRLALRHPMTKEDVSVTAELPDAWEGLAIP